MILGDRDRMIADYTTLGLGVVGLDWTTARRIATDLVDEKLVAAGAGGCGGVAFPQPPDIERKHRP